MKIVLASASPRRADLLRGKLPAFEVDPACTDERTDKVGAEAAREIALRKARAVAARRPGCVVIGADTSVWLGGEQFGKPKNRADAIRMLSALNGKTHTVLTGVAVVCGAVERTDVCASRVTMRWTDAEIAAYVDRFAPYDKAGAYGLQEFGDAHATFEGPFDNIIGLPVDATLKLVAEVSGAAEEGT